MAFTRRAKETIALMSIMGILITYVETMVTPALPVLVKFFDTNEYEGKADSQYCCVFKYG